LTDHQLEWHPVNYHRIIALLVLSASLHVSGTFSQAGEVTIYVHADQVVAHVSRYLTGACLEDVNHEVYGGIYSQMIFGESFQEPPPAANKAAHAGPSKEVSGMWRPINRATAIGRFALVKERPFAGTQSQRIVFESGDGEIGIENQGLNRWGENFVAGKPYEGYLLFRAEQPTTLFVAMESHDGSHVYAEQSVQLEATGDWHCHSFSLTPTASDTAGRVALKLKQPGSVTLGHVFLQPGEWGRFKHLPVRRDVAEGLIDQGVTVLRYGGSMVNSSGYKWKNMIGPRYRRPPYAGTWYKYSSNGWGIPDFMSFCEAAGFEYVPAFNMDETPQDMADFIDYAKSPADSEWGRKRAGDGHPETYDLHYMELGNEERVDDQYAEKFMKLATAIWAKDPRVILVVGDFAYDKPILDPFHFDGAASRITSLAGQRRILQFAKQHDREVWFDLHVWTDQPVKSNGSLNGMFSFADALDKIAADGAAAAKHKVVVFEYNSGNHAIKRALANAITTIAIERDGRLPIVSSANCLQPDKQNDNGWDQGLLFLNPSHVWLQPPGYATQMFARNYLPQEVRCEATGAGGEMHIGAQRSEDGKTLALQIVNSGEQPLSARIHLAGFTPAAPQAQVTELSGPADAVNTAEQPNNIVPRESTWKHGASSHTFPPRSFTVIRFD
jgi:alpha-L-arabinofuranosidase